jgi:transcriptional regulator with XRE-family HTH domain
MSGMTTRTLDDWMDEARQRKGLSWDDVATKAGISRQSLHAIRRGESKPRPSTARALEGVLGWEAGSFVAIDEGQPPNTPGAPTYSKVELQTVSISDADRPHMVRMFLRAALDLAASPEEALAEFIDMIKTFDPPRHDVRRPAERQQSDTEG